MAVVNYETIRVREEGKICYLQIYRPENNNTINDQLIKDCHHVLDSMSNEITIVVLEGLPETFCFGADFKELYQKNQEASENQPHPEDMYELWQRLYTGPFVSIANVKGKVNAGGMGFVSACDIVIADETAVFSLSELLFGIYPAIVFPFLVNKIGLNKANYFTMMTQPLNVEKAYEYGLVNAYAKDTTSLLRRNLLRLKVLSKRGIENYKKYRNQYTEGIFYHKAGAIEANKEMFSNPENLSDIFNFVEKGKYPWE